LFRLAAHCARLAHAAHRHCRVWVLGSEISRHISLGRENSAVGRPHLCDWHSSTESNRNHDLYDRGTPSPPDSGEMPRSHRAIMDSRPHSSHARAPAVTNAAGVLGCDDPLFPHLVEMVWNEGTARVLTEPPPSGTNGVGIQHPSKRKWATIPGGSCGRKRARRKKTQRSDEQERTHVSIIRISPIQERIVIWLVLGEPCYSLAHAPRSLLGGADQVRMRNRAERLETHVSN